MPISNDQEIYGKKVKYVIGSSDEKSVHIFLDYSDELNSIRTVVLDSKSEIWSICTYNQIITFLSGRPRIDALKIYGSILYHLHCIDDLNSRSKLIEESDIEIRNKIIEHIKVIRFASALYLTFAITSMIVFAPYFQYYFTQYKPFVVASLFGMLGSIVFSLRRNINYNEARYLSSREIFMDVGSRLVLGLIFGMMVMCLLRSGLINGVENIRISTVAILGFISGFFEEFIPGILGEIKNGFKKSGN